jgi:hypothetical protein
MSIPQIALLVPVLAVTLATFEDFSTRDRVTAISPVLAYTRLSVMGIFLVLVWLNSILAYFENIQIARLWMKLDSSFEQTVNEEFAVVETLIRAGSHSTILEQPSVRESPPG